jgi:hypothetical protein
MTTSVAGAVVRPIPRPARINLADDLDMGSGGAGGGHPGERDAHQEKTAGDDGLVAHADSQPHADQRADGDADGDGQDP